MLSTSEVLNKAADLIEQRGWTTGDHGWDWHRDATTPLCLEGGILAAMGIPAQGGAIARNQKCDAYRAVKDYLVSTGDLPAGEHLWRFNDDSAEERVVGVLRATALIEAARERESVEV